MMETPAAEAREKFYTSGFVQVSEGSSHMFFDERTGEFKINVVVPRGSTPLGNLNQELKSGSIGVWLTWLGAELG
jgi:hypothetical protein